MSGYNTIEVALFIDAANTTLQTQAKNWLEKHTGGPFTRVRKFIRVDDPDSQPARWVGLAFTTDPGTAVKIKELVAAEPDAKTRMICRSRQKLRELIQAEMDERGWRIKP